MYWRGRGTADKRNPTLVSDRLCFLNLLPPHSSCTLVDIQLPSLKDAPDAWCCCELACWFSRKWVNCHPQQQALGKYCCVFAPVSRDQIVTHHIGFVFDQRLLKFCVYILCLACIYRWLFAQCSALALSRFHSNLGSVAVIQILTFVLHFWIVVWQSNNQILQQLVVCWM